jgi:hypothetical protein
MNVHRDYDHIEGAHVADRPLRNMKAARFMDDQEAVQDEAE